MKSIKARVVNGRLVVDEPSKFPEGTELDLTIADEGDELSTDERRALHQCLRDSWNSAQKGDLKPARELLERLSSAE